MTDKADSSLARMLSVLDLFSDQRLHWNAEDISEALGVSLPTSYRYVKTLSDAGLLRRGPDAQFTLGPRIVVLDHYIRQADPVLQRGIPFMRELVNQTGFDCVVSGLYGDQLLDTHREYGSMPADLSYGRGRPRPLFLGGAAKVILAGLPPPQLHRLLDSHVNEVAAAGLPTDWPAFRRYYSQIRKDGHYFSNGELEANLAAIAVPLYQLDGSVIGALSLVTTVQRMAVIDLSKLTPLIQRAAQEISARLH
ncbi:IclR family transcriptional regulator [Malikia spinosa]|uniref:IclR family transcriptional regulator n=1 Tax=Malikia spinosa TaxID=86180 RepID=A0A7C9IYA4_9BURK|nr:IclR family transcriptional regulator [Malikia spinosa]MYZ52067.1 IclR family transcriptional regulator [Malikia spinosa]